MHPLGSGAERNKSKFENQGLCADPVRVTAGPTEGPEIDLSFDAIFQGCGLGITFPWSIIHTHADTPRPALMRPELEMFLICSQAQITLLGHNNCRKGSASMATASEWVRQMLATAQTEPMGTEVVWKSLERHVGQGEKSLRRVQDVLDYIDRELIERRGGPVMRELWNAVADYREKVQENAAAA